MDIYYYTGERLQQRVQLGAKAPGLHRTDGPGGGRFRSADELARAVSGHWPGPTSRGRPFRRLHWRGAAAAARRRSRRRLQRALGFEVAVETNGTVRPPAGIDWLTVSPKAGSELLVRAGQELKLVFPQPGLSPERLEDLDFRHFFLQPMDGPDVEANTRLALNYCLEHPRWRLSLQTHKLLGIP